MYRHHRQLQQTVRVTMVHEHGRSKQIALFHGRKLPRLAPPLMVVLICAALAVVLFLLFPENAYQRFAMSAKTDAATLEYLRQLHRAQPTNDELSMALAEHLYNAGQYNEAQTVPYVSA